MKWLSSGGHAASRRLTSKTDEVLNLRAIRTSEAKFSHRREMKRNWSGSNQEASARKWGKR